MIPIFVISLLRSHDRRAAIKRQMAHAGLHFTFFDAVDGKLLDDEDLSKVDHMLAEAFCGHSLSRGEIGCALSHVNLYHMMVDNNIERAIVLEDDIYLHMSFIELVDAACKKSTADIIYLRHGKAKSWPCKKSLPEGYRLAKYRVPSRSSKRGIMSTAGYILTLRGAKKLLRHAYPIRMPSDYLTGLLQLNGLIAAGIEPCCLDVDLYATTIDDRAYGHYLEQNADDKPSVPGE